MELQQEKGFFDSLFDFSFEDLITPKIIRFLFGLGIAASAIGVLAMIVGSFAQARMTGNLGLPILLLILSPLIFLVYVILLRVYLELVMVIFKISDNTDEIARRGHTEEGTPSTV